MYNGILRARIDYDAVVNLQNLTFHEQWIYDRHQDGKEKWAEQCMNFEDKNQAIFTWYMTSWPLPVRFMLSTIVSFLRKIIKKSLALVTDAVSNSPILNIEGECVPWFNSVHGFNCERVHVPFHREWERSHRGVGWITNDFTHLHHEVPCSGLPLNNLEILFPHPDPCFWTAVVLHFDDSHSKGPEDMTQDVNGMGENIGVLGHQRSVALVWTWTIYSTQSSSWLCQCSECGKESTAVDADLPRTVPQRLPHLPYLSCHSQIWVLWQ